MVTEPEILVYDEPTSGLDPVTSRVVDGLIEHMRSNHFVTSIVVTHDMMTAYNVADRVVLLAHGKIVANGTPEEVFHSHGAEVEPFAVSSGLDMEHLGPRKNRMPPEEISRRWTDAHPPATAPRRAWYQFGARGLHAPKSQETSS
jgi:phospholipid/cholesterol/gamma-HCH transport system ATP-binding protein